MDTFWARETERTWNLQRPAVFGVNINHNKEIAAKWFGPIEIRDF